MDDPKWKKLVDDLHAAGHESPHLDRLRDRLSSVRASSHADIEREILEEMANSLSRAAEKVDVALLELEVLGKRLDEFLATARPTKNEIVGYLDQAKKHVDAFNAQRDVAKQALWELMVHREAIGFRRNEKLAELYPVPPARKPPAMPDA